MKKYSDAISDRYTARHKKCVEFCGDLNGKRILNIGCYNGWFEKEALEKGCLEIIGIDTNAKSLAIAQEQLKGNAKFWQCCAQDLEKMGNLKFDMVTMFDVLEHIPRTKVEAVLKTVKKILEDNGVLVISVPHSCFLANILDPAWYFGHRHYAYSELKNLFLKNGFQIEEVGYGGGVFEIFSMLLLYFFKWCLRQEIPFKTYFELKREKEYFGKNNAFVTLFLRLRIKRV